ncbi:2-oxoglutarate dehydrogenase E1 component [Azospirillum doebereinerae]|uniref:2-oxoglutarate dehydrogenase E1 component n=1 Tax=Azospirillum doebereinerae TaxID=92933 RepID=A0A3S1CD22_9PROT|nr:2-oxoglutarate dehydrogenase E1 component [Azospirillum doebereinerae]MCG5238616.1 2-oxoglutarate dehydrogenase E1 component [Azospirillum doebereinerae]RUQ61839.1 2-oxoglutarate dehydrogenase E1 component [Azospirillum doebereinerae]
MSRLSSPLNAAGAAYLEALHERYREDPDQVDVSWRTVFQVLDELGAPSSPAGWADPSADPAALLREAIRERGHLSADLDPLRRAPPPPTPAGEDAETARLRRLYEGTLTLETAHIDDADLRAWLRDAYESTDATTPPPDARQRAFALLTAAEEFERLLGVRYPTKKRFGAEGMETLIPLLDRILGSAAAAGVTEVQVGTMHRGRLSLMANVLGKPLVELFAGIKGMHPFLSDPPVPADVPYHMGIDGTLTFGERTLALTLSPNPSHLEAINPVTLGRARARQDLAGEPKRVLCVLLHTDASVIGQGSVTEALQLSGVPGFSVAGTIHIVVNNQIGFTTNPDEARTSRHCTGLWKAVDSPILHVNADDPDAALRAADLAVAFRQEHGRDAVIDLVGYRRNGHNEIDEPRFTQPVEYRAIDAHPGVRDLYAKRLSADGLLAADAAPALAAKHKARFQEALAAAADHRPNHDGFPAGRWAPFAPTATPPAEPKTGLPPDRLRALLASLAAIPDGLTVDRKVERVVRQRAEGDLVWATGEALAIATLLAEGTPVRLTGQDVTRGAFSHRHFALTDTASGRRHVSLNNLGVPQARFDVVNSPLSEHAVLGFEYGYSLERPDALVIWEAQFGDFANGAQIVIDQFLASAEDKWRQPSGLVLLLPHGLEGQGPEHSSARPERFLQMAARDNMQIAHPSTPANCFHLLRRQIHRAVRKPLVVLSPKTLLRLPAAVSPLEEFALGTAFRPVIVTGGEDADVRTLLLCSGKLAYELERERAARGADDVAVVRLEMLYPLPAAELSALFHRWPGARCVWVQEEPRNLGAWGFLDRRLEALREAAGAPHPRVACVARDEAGSPAGSFHGDHDADQRHIVEQAFAGAVAAATPAPRLAVGAAE